jgi:hypothetical protein
MGTRLGTVGNSWSDAASSRIGGLACRRWHLVRDPRLGSHRPSKSPDQAPHAGITPSKLSFGSNPPSMTPPGEQYRPEWTEEDLGSLRASIEMAVDLIRSRVFASG